MDAEPLGEIEHQRRKPCNHLDVLVAIEMSRAETLVADKLNLPLQFGLYSAHEPIAASPQPSEQGENAGKTALPIEQFGWIGAAGKRPALREVQVDAEIEGARRVGKPLSSAGRRQLAGRMIRGQRFPLLNRPSGIGRIGQQRGTSQQAVPKSAQDALVDRPIHSEVVGVENYVGRHLDECWSKKARCPFITAPVADLVGSLVPHGRVPFRAWTH